MLTTRCSNLKELIDRERNAMDLFDQGDSKGQKLSISSQEGLSIDHDIPLARNVLNKLPEYPALIVLSQKIWNILDKTFVPILSIHVQWNALQVSTIHQLQQYGTIFQNVLASNQYSLVEEETQIPLNCY